MSSRRFRRELSEALPDWQQRGWLSPEASSALRDHYQLDRPAPKLGSIILACLGSALLLGGLILVLAHNWDELDRPLRALISVLPLLCTVVLGFWALRKKPDSLALSESLALASSLALALAISLVAQTYQISGDLPRFLLTWAVFTLGISYLLGSGLGLVLFHVLASAWAWNMHDDRFMLPGYLLLVGASLPFFLRRVWGTRRASTCALLPLPLVACLSITLSAPLRHLNGGGWHLAAFASWFALIYLIADSPRRPLGSILRWPAATGLSVILVIFSFSDSWQHLRFAGSWRDTSSTGLLHGTVLLVLLHASLAITALFRRSTMDASAWLWLAAGYIGFVAYLGQPLAGTELWYMIATNLFAAALALVTMATGIRQMNTLRTNLGWLLLSALILCRFFDTELSYLVRGLAFIALGLGFLGLNLFLMRRQKSLPPQS